METKPISIANTVPFSKGGNRLCFVSPESEAICLKVHQKGRKPADRKRRRGLRGVFRKRSAFDENLQEWLALSRLWKAFPDCAHRHLPKTYGLRETDLGTAHSMELIRNRDGTISRTLEQVLWQDQRTPLLDQALMEFRRNWAHASPPTRDLLPHNLLLRIDEGGGSIVVVDGLGRIPRIPMPFLLRRVAARRRLKKLDLRLKEVESRKHSGEVPKARIFHLKANR